MPPAPRSLKPTLSNNFSFFRILNNALLAFNKCLPKKAFGSCTAPRFCSFSSSVSSIDAKLAPAKPLLSVALPTKIKS